MNLTIKFDTEGRTLEQTADIVHWIAAMISDGFTSGPVPGKDGRPVGTWSVE